MCEDLIPYTSYPNTRLGLHDKDDYEKLLSMVHTSAQNCSDPETIRWGVCNSVFPRCLLGYPLYMCKDICMGEWLYLHGGRN